MVSSSDVQEAIKYSVEKLGYESLKPEQEKVVREFLSGNDVLLPYPPALASHCAVLVCLMLLTG